MDGKIYIDLSKTHGAGHRSGLNRFNSRLAQELAILLPNRVSLVKWHRWRRCFISIDGGRSVHPKDGDTYIIGEAFDQAKRWGWLKAVKSWPGNTVAIFHDNIPELYPDICFPHVVKRHPDYLAALKEFKQVLSVSQASRDDLEITLGDACPACDVIGCGGDFYSLPQWDKAQREKKLKTVGDSITALMVGIVEPRKNQSAALKAQRLLADKGIQLKLEVAGRLNAHFGPKILRDMNDQAAEGFHVKYLGSLDDRELAMAYQRADVVLFPSLAEGFGIPPFEALASGVPCVTSKIPGPSEFLPDGPFIWLDSTEADSIAAGLIRFLEDEDYRSSFVNRVQGLDFPKWSDVAQRVVASLD